MLKLLGFLKPYRIFVILSMILLFIQALCDLYLPTLMAHIINKGVLKNDLNIIIPIGILMLVVSLISVVSTIISSYFSTRSGIAFGRDIRSALFKHVEDFSLQEFEAFGSSTLITRTTNDITQVQNFIVVALRMLIRAPLMITGSLIMAFSLDFELSLIFIIILPVLAGLIFFVALKGSKIFKEVQNKLDQLNQILRENLSGVRVIRAFVRTPSERKKFTTANSELMKTSLKAQKIMAIMGPGMTIIMSMTALIIVWFGGLRISAGQLQVGEMIAFLQYGQHILMSLTIISMVFVMLSRSTVSAKRIKEVLDYSISIKNPKEPKLPEKISGQIEFKNVSFRYPGAEANALTDITFTAYPGETTAIVGGTGSGKTTLISLIPRLYEVVSGSILIDGIDVRHWNQEDLRKRIGFVPQKSLLFTDTIEGNIRFGREGISKEQIDSAIETAQAEKFIEDKTEGTKTFVSQGGSNFSGGQKQRLSIARALADQPEIYVFDDSFSALDFKTDSELRASLAQKTQNACVIIVAQRIGTISHADRIIVLEEGRVVGMGKHKELLKNCSVYQEIAASQFTEAKL